jgi:hypothetical protein
MATAKTTTLTFRIDPGLKEALRTAAVREHREHGGGNDSGLLRTVGCAGSGHAKTGREGKAQSKPTERLWQLKRVRTRMPVSWIQDGASL